MPIWKMAALLLIVLMTFSAFAKERDKTKMTDSAKTQVQLETRPNMLVPADWLAQQLNNPTVVVVYVGRERSGYDAGHVPGSHFLALSDIAVTRNGIPNELAPPEQLKSAFERLGIDDKTKRIVLYGDNMGLFAARAWFTLAYVGLGERAALLDGGLEEWKAKGLPTATDSPAPRLVGKVAVKLHPEFLADTTAVRRAVEPANGNTVLIDARPPVEFAGGPAEGVSRPGHIPEAKNVFWVELLESKERPVIKPAPDLRAAYAQAGVAPGKEIIVYCRTGVQAAHDFFTLRLLGYDPKLYDGSFFEWSNLPDTPVQSGQ